MAGIYTIGSKLGYDLATGMKVGDRITATDGSIWTKNADGTIGVLHNGQQKVGQITYQPTVAMPTRQEQVAGMTGGSGYTSPYAGELQAVLSGLRDSKWEGWEKDEDPSYQAYRKEYLREADRTMEDTLGAYAQNTGGIAGSQAITAASQAADYYKSQLNDKIPELYDNAYSRYLRDVARQQNMADLLMSAETMSQNQYYNQINYAMNKWAQMGYADQEVAGILGVTAGTPTSDQSYTDWATAFEREQFEAEQAVAALKAAGSGSGGAGSSGGVQDYEGLYAAAFASGSPESYIANNYKKYGFATANGLSNGYKSWTEEEGPDGPTLKKYNYDTLVKMAKTVYDQRKDPAYLANFLYGRGYSEQLIDHVFGELGL